MNEKLNENSLWDPALQETFKRLDPETRYKFQKMFGALQDKTVADPHVINMEVATQIKLMLRDGLHPDSLDENEREIFINTFGKESLNIFYEVECTPKKLIPDSSTSSEIRNPDNFKRISQKMIHKKSKSLNNPLNNHLNKKLNPKCLTYDKD